MEFWSWYLRGILNVPKAMASGLGEYMIGVVALTVSSIVLATQLSPLWLLVSVPIGITICVHGWWRQWGRD